MNVNISIPVRQFTKRFVRSRYLLIMLVPALVYVALFCYRPMWGVLISFKQYSPFLGFTRSPWVGLKYFRLFFSSSYSFRVIRNTFLLSFYSILFGFPIPVIFALYLNEIRTTKLKKFLQTVSYMPHFLSTVVVVSMITMFLSPTTGFVNTWLVAIGIGKINFMSEPGWFRPIYILSGTWQQMGWASIIYLAALTRIDPQLYEAAEMDGAGKFQQILKITLPGLMPTIVTLLLLRLGKILTVGFEKVFLMQTPVIYSTADVIQTFVYRQGMVNGNFGYATAVGLFDALVSVLFLIGANTIAKRVNETSLW